MKKSVILILISIFIMTLIFASCRKKPEETSVPATIAITTTTPAVTEPPLDISGENEAQKDRGTESQEDKLGFEPAGTDARMDW